MSSTVTVPTKTATVQAAAHTEDGDQGHRKRSCSHGGHSDRAKFVTLSEPTSAAHRSISWMTYGVLTRVIKLVILSVPTSAHTGPFRG